MKIRRALKQDVTGLENLFELHGAEFNEDFINKKDLSFVAVEKEKVIGFIWVGLVANSSIGYIDFFFVDPEHVSKGVGKALGHKMKEIAKKKSVKQLVGQIEAQNVPSIKCAQNIGMNFHPNPWAVMFLNLESV